jgi:hypothetical protein
MAIQEGLDPKVGTVGKMTYYKGRDGQYRVRRKGGVSATRIAKDPKFQRTRETMAEFAAAGKAGKLMRQALASFTKNVADRIMTARLVKELFSVIKSDAVNFRGSRNVVDGNLGLLRGFNFNVVSSLSTVLHTQYTTGIDRATGKLTVSIPSFITEKLLTAPFEATHFKIFSAAAEIDFVAGTYTIQSSASDVLSKSQLEIPAIVLTNSLTANSTHPLFLLVGVEFSMEEHGKFYSLSNGAFNPLEIVDVSIS